MCIVIKERIIFHLVHFLQLFSIGFLKLASHFWARAQRKIKKSSFSSKSPSPIPTFLCLEESKRKTSVHLET